MGAFFDRLTAFGQPLTIAAVLMRIGLAMVIGAVIGIARMCWCASARRLCR